MAEDMGVRIHYYHADNGRFADKGLVQDCQMQRQGLTYCGVNTHFQNGIAEKKIRDLLEQTRTMMLHALHRWSSMLSIHLWQYGLRTANDICNATPCKGSDISPIESFSGVAVCLKMKQYHAFGCPTYILDKDLQAQKSLPKWQNRARLRVYLGPSPSHSRSMSLVLNHRTGHMTPQFSQVATWKELSGLTVTQYKKAVPSTIKPLSDPAENPESAINHTSQENQDPHLISLEPTENEHLMEKAPIAMAPQEEPACASEQHFEQRQS